MNDYMKCINQMIADMAPYGKYSRGVNRTLFPLPRIKKVIFSPPVTIVIWSDGSKTMVKTDEKDEFNPEIGLAMAIAKRYFGTRSQFQKKVKNAMDDYKLRCEKIEERQLKKRMRREEIENE